MQRLTKEQAAIIGAFTGYSCGANSAMHQYIERKLGRPVWTHEMGDERLWPEIRKACLSDFLELCYKEEPEGEDLDSNT